MTWLLGDAPKRAGFTTSLGDDRERTANGGGKAPGSRPRQAVWLIATSEAGTVKLASCCSVPSGVFTVLTTR